jgi:ABC-type uncharacterized transport system permease subunit
LNTFGVIAAADAAHTTAASPAFYLAVGIYVIAALCFCAAFAELPPWLTRAARWLLVVGFVCHGVDISLRGFAGVHPGSSVREALGFLSWLLAGGYFFWSLKYDLKVLGAFVTPLVVVMLALARLSPSGQAVPELTVLGRIHISLATIGVAVFSLATIVAAVYLLQERTLKKKNFDGVLYKNATALETLDRLAHRLVLVGFPIFTLAIMLGVFWVAKRGTSFARIEYPIAGITWIAFASLIIARTARGWRGRRAAWLTILGFAAAMIVLAIYLGRRAVGG